MKDEPRPISFSEVARQASCQLGTPYAFAAAFGVIFLSAVSGPMFGYSDTWQLVINTGTTIVTFLMVFLVQNTQNRDARALHLKLDEILRSIDPPATRSSILRIAPTRNSTRWSASSKLCAPPRGQESQSALERPRIFVPTGREDCVKHGIQKNFWVSGTLHAGHG